MKKAKLIIIASLLMLAGSASAQVSTPATPLTVSRSGEIGTTQYVPQIALSLPAIPETQKVKPGKKNVLQPAYIGVVTNTDVSFANEGNITTLDDGSKVWRLQIAMPGAKALGLYYDKFNLPSGVQYFLYNSNKKQLLGAYTAANNPQDGYWVTEKVQGDVINLEMDIAPGVHMSDIVFHVNKVVDYYAGISYLSAYTQAEAEKTTGGPYFPYKGSSPCEINAICALGDSFPQQRKATIGFEYLVGQGAAAASATLINNTRQDCTPYILTATHTEATNSTSDATFSQWMFYFNYETATCTYTGPAPVPGTMTGATFVSRASYDEASNIINGDFLLLKLKQSIPAAYGAYFAGWDLDSTDTTGTFTGFHHPAGDVKKVSQTNEISAASNVNGEQNTHWGLVWNQGYVEEGSSGSGLFNSSGRLIGIASVAGPYNPACTDTDFIGYGPFDAVEYSKISLDWLYAYQTPSTTTSRLKDWLDPDNTGLTKIGAIPATCSNTGIAQQTTQGDMASVYPNPTTGVTYATISLSEPTTLKIDVYNTVGMRISEQTITNATSGNYKIDLGQCANGMYMVQINTNKMQVTKKIILNR